MITKDISELELKRMIGKMLIFGFDSLDINENNEIYHYIRDYNLGGVILFDKLYYDKDKAKNIQNPLQLKRLTKKLQEISKNKLLISIDQEGGKIARLKIEDGFNSTISAKKLVTLGKQKAKQSYSLLSEELQELGINCNFAPLVDLSLNKESDVIYKLDRSYGDNVDEIIEYAKIFMDELSKHKVVSCLKHFPGHGSALGDSHEGFVDVSDTWSKAELEPYKKLLSKIKMIMTAHVFNKNIDDKYPATLSYKTNTLLLREEIGYDGIVLSDELQMKAIELHYTKKEAIKLSINSGVDMIMYCNQLSNDNVLDIINIIFAFVKNGDIDISRIKEANKRIEKLLGEI
ncbi:MAG: glycoside hydrolase family 3 protein [Sulfurimonas sp.]|nr:glycoside hydrolase family 3 protein [Sulfurimonas sp.]